MYNCTVALFNYNYHKFFDREEIRISSKKTSAFQEWCQMTPFMVVYALIYCDIFLLQRFLVCVSIVDFWFADILKFWYESMYMRLSCWSLNCKFISSVLHLYPPLLMISDFGGIIVHGWFCIIIVYIYIYWWALSFAIFLFMVMAFSFPTREFLLVFVVKLV